MQREKKTEIITLRVTPQVKERIRAKARELGLTSPTTCVCAVWTKRSSGWMVWIRCSLS